MLKKKKYKLFNVLACTDLHQRNCYLIGQSDWLTDCGGANLGLAGRASVGKRAAKCWASRETTDAYNTEGRQHSCRERRGVWCFFCLYFQEKRGKWVGLSKMAVFLDINPGSRGALSQMTSLPKSSTKNLHVLIFPNLSTAGFSLYHAHCRDTGS